MTLPKDANKILRKTVGTVAGFVLISTIFTSNFGLTEVVPSANDALQLLNKNSIVGILFLSFIFLIIELFLKSELPFNNVALIVFSLVYLAIPFSLLTFFSYSKANEFSPNVVAGILFLTWANDSFAYLVGSKIGKTPFFLRVSPKKTWEGTIGGGIFCMATAAIIAQFFTQLTLQDWLIIGGIIAVFGTIGDLVESLLKRSVGVKDSGSFMPGHGGFLDRFDAFVFCIPFVYFYLSVIKHLF